MTISPLVCEAFSLHTPLALISPFQKLYIHGSVLISTVCERMTVTRNSDFEFSDAPLDLDRNAPRESQSIDTGRDALHQLVRESDSDAPFSFLDECYRISRLHRHYLHQRSADSKG